MSEGPDASFAVPDVAAAPAATADAAQPVATPAAAPDAGGYTPGAGGYSPGAGRDNPGSGGPPDGGGAAQPADPGAGDANQGAVPAAPGDAGDGGLGISADDGPAEYDPGAAGAGDSGDGGPPAEDDGESPTAATDRASDDEDDGPPAADSDQEPVEADADDAARDGDAPSGDEAAAELDDGDAEDVEAEDEAEGAAAPDDAEGVDTDEDDDADADKDVEAAAAPDDDEDVEADGSDDAAAELDGDSSDVEEDEAAAAEVADGDVGPDEDEAAAELDQDEGDADEDEDAAAEVEDDDEPDDDDEAAADLDDDSEDVVQDPAAALEDWQPVGAFGSGDAGPAGGRPDSSGVAAQEAPAARAHQAPVSDAHEAPVASAVQFAAAPSSQATHAAQPHPGAPLDLGAWKPIEHAGTAEPPAAAAHTLEPLATPSESDAGGSATDEESEGEAAAAIGDDPESDDTDDDSAVGGAMLEAESDAESIRAEDAHGAARRYQPAALDDAEATDDDNGDDPDADTAQPGTSARRRREPELLGAAAAQARASRWAGGGNSFAEAMAEIQDPPRSVEEVYQRSSSALERLTGIRPDEAWMEAGSIDYGSSRSLGSTFATTRSGGGRVDPQALELALSQAGRGEPVDDDLIAAAATAAVGVLQQALRSLGTPSGGGGVADVFEDGATEAFIRLHAEEWLGQLGFYDAFPGARSDPGLSGDRLARTYTWQCVAARGYLERFAQATGRMPTSSTDDFVKSGGGMAGLNRLHLDYLRAQRREGVDPDPQAEAAAAQRMTEEAHRLVTELAAEGLRDPASAGDLAASVADRVMAGIAVAG